MKVYMCGVFGGVGRSFLTEDVVEGLRELEYRGYDSWGVAYLDDDHLTLFREVGKVTQLPKSVSTHLALGHTRWATHGGVTVANAHPHIDSTGKYAVVHNGIIENAQALRSTLPKVAWRSQTDTEIAIHLYSAFREAGKSPVEAVRSLVKPLKGSSAFVFLDSSAAQLIVTTQGLPLLLGASKGNYWVVSDLQALAGISRQYAVVPDGAIAILDDKDCRVFGRDGMLVSLQWLKLPDTYKKSLASGESAMWNEMQEQSAVVARWRQYEPQKNFLSLQKKFSQARKVWFTGCGTAFFAGVWASWEARARGLDAEAILASEWEFHLLRVKKDDLVVCLSQSGETFDVLSALESLKARGAFCAALINVPSSSLERKVDLTLHLQAGPEKAVASTKAFSAKLCALWRLMDGDPLELLEAEKFLTQKLPAHLPKLQEIASLWKSGVFGCFVLGRGQDAILAQEIALKIKEVSYIHAEALSSSELKHGSLALVDTQFPTLIISSRQHDAEVLQSSIQEILARDGSVTEWSAKKNEILPSSRFAAQLCGVVLGQYLAYFLAKEKGLNPDRPRNLAKSVTVG